MPTASIGPNIDASIDLTSDGIDTLIGALRYAQQLLRREVVEEGHGE